MIFKKKRVHFDKTYIWSEKDFKDSILHTATPLAGSLEGSTFTPVSELSEDERTAIIRLDGIVVRESNTSYKVKVKSIFKNNKKIFIKTPPWSRVLELMNIKVQKYHWVDKEDCEEIISFLDQP